MQKRIPIKNPAQEIQLVTKRAVVACIIIGISLFFLVARLSYLQIYKHPLYTTLTKKNWLDLVPLEPTRGLIYDRNGILLAENIPIFSLDLIPYQVKSIEKTLTELKKVITLSETDIVQFQKQRKQLRRFDEIPIKFRLSEEEVIAFAENQHRFPGVMVKARLMRHYPLGIPFSHVLGYVGRINQQEMSDINLTNYSASHYIGKLGIEKYYEDDLHGTVGYEEVENDASGKSIRVLSQVKATSGKTIYLTIDSRLQTFAAQALTGHRGAIVVIQPNNGQVLAMVSEPSYDPNLFVSGITQKEFQVLQQAEDRPLYNRALRGLYPLASTIKPFVAIEGLDSHIITATDTLHDPGWFQLKNSSHIFHDWRKYGHGTVNLEKAIMSSCDTYFFHLAAKLGIRRIESILTQFGFGQITGIDMDHELTGLVASPEWKRRVKGIPWYEGDTIISVIGQCYMQTTPLQLATAVATLATHGKRFIPTLLLGDKQPGKQYYSQPPLTIGEIHLNNPKNWDIVIKAMEKVISSREGTAHRFVPHPAYTIAGKTGTGQVYSKNYMRGSQLGLPEKLRDHYLFIAFAPIDNPQIALAIVTENSTQAVSIAKTIIDFYFKGAANGHQLSKTAL